MAPYFNVCFDLHINLNKSALSNTQMVKVNIESNFYINYSTFQNLKKKRMEWTSNALKHG